MDREDDGGSYGGGPGGGGGGSNKHAWHQAGSAVSNDSSIGSAADSAAERSRRDNSAGSAGGQSTGGGSATAKRTGQWQRRHLVRGASSLQPLFFRGKERDEASSLRAFAAQLSLPCTTVAAEMRGLVERVTADHRVH
ncbi:unnamed protein product [Phaeothamnion confervicola]